MSWCPKCKNEYRAGIAICPDCNEALLEELNETEESNLVPLFRTTDEELTDRICQYLLHCNINAKKLPVSAEGEFFHVLLVPEAQAKEAALEVQTVLSYETKEKEKAENGDVEAPTQKKSKVPVSNLHLSAKERYQEYKSSGIMLLTFSALIIVFAVLNFLGVITIMASTPSLIVLGIAAVIFIYLGISSLRSTGRLLEEADEEEKTTDSILIFLKDKFPAEKLLSMKEDDMTDEILYFTQLNAMKEALLEQYPDAEENYIDAVLDDYYTSLDI